MPRKEKTSHGKSDLWKEELSWTVWISSSKATTTFTVEENLYTEKSVSMWVTKCAILLEIIPWCYLLTTAHAEVSWLHLPWLKEKKLCWLVYFQYNVQRPLGNWVWLPRAQRKLWCRAEMNNKPGFITGHRTKPLSSRTVNKLGQNNFMGQGEGFWAGRRGGRSWAGVAAVWQGIHTGLWPALQLKRGTSTPGACLNVSLLLLLLSASKLVEAEQQVSSPVL